MQPNTIMIAAMVFLCVLQAFNFALTLGALQRIHNRLDRLPRRVASKNINGDILYEKD